VFVEGKYSVTLIYIQSYYLIDIEDSVLYWNSAFVLHESSMQLVLKFIDKNDK